MKNKKNNKINWKVLSVCFLIVAAAAFIGSLFTSGNTNSEWYKTNKPAITPPDFIFPIVWTILYFLIGVSLYFAWVNANRNQKKNIAFLFGINLFANAFWSYLFFEIKNPFFSFLDLLLIFLTIVWIIITNWKISKISSLILLPYLLWVGFAGILNFLFIS